jgi:hypothetical protein
VVRFTALHTEGDLKAALYPFLAFAIWFETFLTGSDCPLFLHNLPAWSSGNEHIVLILPTASLSIFSLLSPGILSASACQEFVHFD